MRDAVEVDLFKVVIVLGAALGAAQRQVLVCSAPDLKSGHLIVGGDFRLVGALKNVAVIIQWPCESIWEEKKRVVVREGSKQEIRCVCQMNDSPFCLKLYL